jgi:hypothetical protein
VTSPTDNSLRLAAKTRIPPPRNVLCSYFYYRRIDLDKLSYCRIVADSGAFSARQATQSYRDGSAVTSKRLAAWTKKWEDRLCWVAAIDVESAEQTKRNWLKMLDEGIPAVSTLHLGDPPELMDWYVNQGVDFLGLGGTAGSSANNTTKLRWLIKCFKYARENHPQMRFHGWGMTGADFLRLPFYSVDSSGWGSSYRYGRIQLRHPADGKMISVPLDGKGIYTKQISEMLIDYYGVTPSEIAKAGPHNRLLLVRLSALAASVQEQQWRKTFRRHPISAPQWGRLKGWTLNEGPNQHLALSGCGAGLRERVVFDELHGPHMHLVDGHAPHLQVVNGLIKEEDG